MPQFITITEIRPADLDGTHPDFQEDCVELEANEFGLVLNWRDAQRKLQCFPFSYEEFDKMILAVSAARRIEQIVKE